MNERDYLAFVATPALAYTACIEHTPIGDMRITHVYRRETDSWKIAHRHVDHNGERRQP